MTPNQKMWKLMRALSRFTFEDLVVTTGCNNHTARNYVSLLMTAGYVRVVGTVPAMTKPHKVYLLVKNTGPEAPVCHDCLYDPNTQQAYLNDTVMVIKTVPKKKKGVPHVD